jgi:hypothetical protein
MKNFRRSVIRLFMATLFLLFIAWVGMKAMQYHGDYEGMIRDAKRFLRENDVIEFIRHKAMRFWR